MTETYYMGSTNHIFRGSVIDGPVPDHFRPVAVIDPTDTEAVERLWRIWTTLAPDHRLAQDNMQAALREFAAPTPAKPEEPTGLGAVVEDASGVRWLRVTTNGAADCWKRNDGRFDRYEWREFNAVRIVSAGVES